MKMKSIEILKEAHVLYRIGEYPTSVKNAEEASKYIGVPTRQMYKSIVVIDGCQTHHLCLVPSSATIDLSKIADGHTELAKPQVISTITGYQMGSVSPLGLAQKISIYLDTSAMSYDEIGIGSGEFGKEIILNPKDLMKITNTKLEKITV